MAEFVERVPAALLAVRMPGRRGYSPPRHIPTIEQENILSGFRHMYWSARDRSPERKAVVALAVWALEDEGHDGWRSGRMRIWSNNRKPFDCERHSITGHLDEDGLWNAVSRSERSRNLGIPKVVLPPISELFWDALIDAGDMWS
jgi:hypothetical protein